MPGRAAILGVARRQPAQPELRSFLSSLEAGQGNVADAV